MLISRLAPSKCRAGENLSPPAPPLSVLRSYPIWKNCGGVFVRDRRPKTKKPEGDPFRPFLMISSCGSLFSSFGRPFFFLGPFFPSFGLPPRPWQTPAFRSLLCPLLPPCPRSPCLF